MQIREEDCCRPLIRATTRVVGTRTRRQTIGLMPSNQTLISTIASASEADGTGLSSGRGCFGRRFIQPVYRLVPTHPTDPDALLDELPSDVP
jgi:hypothetical protein